MTDTDTELRTEYAVDQTSCVRCGLDIEGNPKQGWRDRGGNTSCPAGHLFHKPSDHFKVTGYLEWTHNQLTHQPFCSGVVVEQDKAIRWNRLDRNLDTHNGAVYAHLGEANFEGDGFLCTTCYQKFDELPGGAEIVDWWS